MKFNMDKCRNAESQVSFDHIRTILDYDSISGLLIWKHRENNNFNSKYAGNIAGAVHRSGALQIQVLCGDKRRLFWAHRIAWVHHYGVWPDYLVDHRDGNPQNNAIGNLRIANGFQNAANKHELRGAVGFKGVYCWTDGRYAAQIKSDYKWRWLGLHDDVVNAAAAYDAAAIELHGDFAVTNQTLGLYRKHEIGLLA